MKYYKRLKIYKANNVTFDPVSMIADSYDWWHFVERINGKVVFNSYSYSPTTGRHQSKVWRLLQELGIEVDLVVHTKAGLQASYGEMGHEGLAIEAMEYAIRNETIKIAEQISKLFKIPLTRRFIQNVYELQETQQCNEYLERAYKYDQKKRAQEFRTKGME